MDFEALSRDLVQAKEGIFVESFTAGRDGGIDLRYAKPQGTATVIQCKHYKSGYDKLLSKIKTEAMKLSSLKMDRYLLLTSVGLTPANKDEIIGIIQPYCSHVVATVDIIGRDDLNSLLGVHTEVEERHFKLWMSSTAILQHILQRGAFDGSVREEEYIKRRLSLYVQSESASRAAKILDDLHVCIITGTPGIGKTTLAEILLMRHVAMGFELIRIWRDPNEVDKQISKEKRQIVYFDDFLGSTGKDFGRTQNEDSRLLRLMNDVNASENLRFILTTREYILNQARLHSEKLRRANTSIYRCVVELSDYSYIVRARILYNHLYFSQLNEDFILAIATPDSFREICGHRNFNPRLIEFFTDPHYIGATTPENYPSYVTSLLDNPHDLWEFAFRNHITEEARSVLLAMLSLPSVCALSDVASVFALLHSAVSARLNLPRERFEFESAIKVLDGAMMHTAEGYHENVAWFINPSIRDYLESLMFRHDEVFDDVMRSIVTIEQAENLWRRPGAKGRHPRMSADALLPVVLAGFVKPSQHFQSHRFGEKPPIWIRDRVDYAARFLFAIDLGFTGVSPEEEDLCLVFDDKLQTSDWKRDSLLQLLQRLHKQQRSPGFDMVYRTAIERVLEDFDVLDDFELVLNQIDDDSELLGEGALGKLRAEFPDLADAELDAARRQTDDHEQMASRATRVREIGEYLGLDICIDQILEEARLLQSEEETRGWGSRKRHLDTSNRPDDIRDFVASLRSRH